MQEISATYLGWSLCPVFIVQQNNWILGQPQGTGGLKRTTKTSFMVSNNNTPLLIGEKNALETQKLQQELMLGMIIGKLSPFTEGKSV